MHKKPCPVLGIAPSNFSKIPIRPLSRVFLKKSLHILEVMFVQHSHSLVAPCLVQQRHSHVQVSRPFVTSDVESKDIQSKQYNEYIKNIKFKIALLSFVSLSSSAV